MKNQKFVLLLSIFIFSLCFIACKDKSISEVEPLSCTNLNTSIIDRDSELLAEEINKLTKDLEPKPTAADVLGHLQNFNTLMQGINNHCDNIIIEMGCYACIKTLPLQSELFVRIDSSGTQINRVIDISTPSDAVLKFAGIHSN